MELVDVLRGGALVRLWGRWVGVALLPSHKAQSVQILLSPPQGGATRSQVGGADDHPHF